MRSRAEPSLAVNHEGRGNECEKIFLSGTLADRFRPRGRCRWIAVLWASGIEFAIYPQSGILILLAAAVFTLTPLRWAPGVGALVGLFVFVGFLASPTGVTNLVGRAGTSVAIGQGSRRWVC
jgi:hypothetical protein